MNVVNDKNNFDQYCLKNNSTLSKNYRKQNQRNTTFKYNLKLSDELVGEGNSMCAHQTSLLPMGALLNLAGGWQLFNLHKIHGLCFWLFSIYNNLGLHHMRILP